MFAGLASPSHLIIVLVLVLLLFGAKGLGTGIKELREGISSSDSTEASESEEARSGARAGQRSL